MKLRELELRRSRLMRDVEDARRDCRRDDITEDELSEFEDVTRARLRLNMAYIIRAQGAPCHALRLPAVRSGYAMYRLRRPE